MRFDDNAEEKIKKKLEMIRLLMEESLDIAEKNFFKLDMKEILRLIHPDNHNEEIESYTWETSSSRC